MWVFDLFYDVFEHFSDPKKRVCIGYVFISIGIAFLWLIVLKKLSVRQAFWKVFDKKVFFSRSSKSDYSVFLINRIFTLFISPLLITQMAIATVIFHLLHKIELFDINIFSNLSKIWIVLFFTIFILILLVLAEMYLILMMLQNTLSIGGCISGQFYGLYIKCIILQQN